MMDDNPNYCYYSDLPSPAAYESPIAAPSAPFPIPAAPVVPAHPLSLADIDRIIEMAWEDRTPFDAIFQQFGLREADVKKLMKKHMKFGSYKLWRTRVEACATKHAQRRSPDINRFRCSRQRTISGNKISKR
jgi:uncharacterized protein (TIGR03643 family)